MDPWGEAQEVLASLAIRTDPGLLERARAYLGELRRWSTVARLTAYQDEARQIDRLIVESLLLLAALPDAAGPLLDIGTGSGVPGLILKFARPEWPVVLVEAKRRRANFVRHVVRTLALEGITIEHGRAEGLAGQARYRGQFRTVTMRAVAGPVRAWSLAAPFLHPEGRLVMPLASRGRAVGAIREVVVVGRAAILSRRCRFLIIPGGPTEGPEADVPRETGGGTWPTHWPWSIRRAGSERRRPP